MTAKDAKVAENGESFVIKQPTICMIAGLNP